MFKKLINRASIVNILLSVIAVIVTLFLIITSSYIKENYNIKAGSVSPKKFIATDTIKNEYATQKRINEAVNSVSPLYTHNPDVQKQVLSDLNTFFLQCDKFIADLKQKETNTTPDGYIYQSLSPSGDKADKNISSKVYLTQGQLESLKNLSEDNLKSFKDSIIKITTSALEQGIREDSQAKNLSYIKDELTNAGLSENLVDLGYTIISSVIEPNLVVDEEATLKARQEKANEVEPIMILKNQKIVDEGEIITEEIYSILESMGYINKNNILENIVPIIGTAISIILLFLLVLFYIYRFDKTFHSDKKKVLLLFTLYMILIIFSRLTTGLPYMFVPILLFTMLVSMLLNSRIAIILNFAVSFICSLIYHGDINFVFYFCMSGMLTALTTKYTVDRSRILFIGIINSFIYSVIMLGITLFFDKTWEISVVKNITYAFLNGVLTLILCFGSLPIWEAVFGIVTSVKLLDLTNPNRTILRRLMIEAPGTYHHSLIVANLAEAAAYDVGANPMLARVGGYYHDIGKLKYPQYFSENIVGENIHEKMDPHTSVQVIKSHVSAGIEYADSYKLPKPIIDIIDQHHGNTLVTFFYIKAKKMYTEEMINEDDFRYNHTIPQTKEAAIVMLSDTVEAAVRSMIPSSKSMKEVEEFVSKLIKGKLDDNQLLDSNLTIKDLAVIKKSFMGIFKGMYHERIPYPDDEKEKKEIKEEKTDLIKSENNSDKEKKEI